MPEFHRLEERGENGSGRLGEGRLAPGQAAAVIVGLSALYRFPIEFYRDRGPGYWVARLIVYLDLQGLIQRPGRYNGAGNNNDGRDSSSPGPRLAHIGRLVH